MEWLKKLWIWLLNILSFIGIILIYVFKSKDKAQVRVSKIENEISEIEKDIIKKEKERKELLNDANDHAERGAKIDKQIAKAKEKKRQLDEKRKMMRDIFAKYGDK